MTCWIGRGEITRFETFPMLALSSLEKRKDRETRLLRGDTRALLTLLSQRALCSHVHEKYDAEKPVCVCVLISVLPSTRTAEVGTPVMCFVGKSARKIVPARCVAYLDMLNFHKRIGLRTAVYRTYCCMYRTVLVGGSVPQQG